SLEPKTLLEPDDVQMTPKRGSALAHADQAKPRAEPGTKACAPIAGCGGLGAGAAAVVLDCQNEHASMGLGVLRLGTNVERDLRRAGFRLLADIGQSFLPHAIDVGGGARGQHLGVAVDIECYFHFPASEPLLLPGEREQARGKPEII